MENIKEEKNTIRPSGMDHMNILTYNVWGLPIWLPKVGVNLRFSKIGDKLLNDDYDIICLQECFSKRFRTKILRSLDQHYYYRQEYHKNRRSFLGIKADYFGGLMTFSKYPIISERFFPFPSESGMKKSEEIGRKGFLVSKIVNQKEDTINIINTHLYAGSTEKDEYFRKMQIEYMDSVLVHEGLYDDTCILTGDINVDHPEVSEAKGKSYSKVYRYITDDMKFEDTVPVLSQILFTVDYRRNSFSSRKDGRQKLDYIFIRREDNDWQVTNNVTRFHGSESFSDHLAFCTEISL